MLLSLLFIFNTHRLFRPEKYWLLLLEAFNNLAGCRRAKSERYPLSDSDPRRELRPLMEHQRGPVLNRGFQTKYPLPSALGKSNAVNLSFRRRL